MSDLLRVQSADHLLVASPAGGVRWRSRHGRTTWSTVTERYGHCTSIAVYFDPLAVPRTVVDWEDAPEAWLEPATKLVIRR